MLRYQIKAAISCWVQMNFSFWSKFNLSPDRKRELGEGWWWRFGSGELSWWIWTKAGGGHRRIGYNGRRLWSVIPLSGRQSRDRGRGVCARVCVCVSEGGYSGSFTCANMLCSSTCGNIDKKKNKKTPKTPRSVSLPSLSIFNLESTRGHSCYRT